MYWHRHCLELLWRGGNEGGVADSPPSVERERDPLATPLTQRWLYRASRIRALSCYDYSISTANIHKHFLEFNNTVFNT